jgi:hypothetical protein
MTTFQHDHADELRLPLEGWVDVSDVTPPDRRVVAAVVAAALATDLALRSGVIVLAGALLVLVVSGGALATGRVTNRRAWPLLCAAPLFGLCLMARTSPWLLPLDVLAVAGLLVLGATLSRTGDPADLTVPGLLGRGVHALVHGTLAPAFLAGPLLHSFWPRERRHAAVPAARSGRGSALARGALLAAPVVLVVGLLLASADAVFASFFRVPTDVGDLVAHAVMLGVGAWGAAGLLRLASAAPFEMPVRRRWPLGRTEAVTVLGALVAILAAFAASQLVAAVGGASYVRRTAGLSYAEYARSGFFQLLGVAAISLAVLLAVRATVDMAVDRVARRRFLVLAEAAVVLTLLVVAVAARRLFLYEQAYGLTMLRLCSPLVAAWIGGVFVLLGVALTGAGAARGRNWLAPAAIALALAGLLATNAANPEAIVVRRNVARFAGTDKLDVDYLTDQLTDDAVPALVDAMGRMRPEDAAEVRRALCFGAPATLHATGGLWAYNNSADKAIEARQRVCATAGE